MELLMRKLTSKQKKIAGAAKPRNRITKADFVALKGGGKRKSNARQKEKDQVSRQ